MGKNNAGVATLYPENMDLLRHATSHYDKL